MMFLFVELGNSLVFDPFRVHPGLSWFHQGGGKFLTYVILESNHDGGNVV